MAPDQSLSPRTLPRVSLENLHAKVSVKLSLTLPAEGRWHTSSKERKAVGLGHLFFSFQYAASQGLTWQALFYKTSTYICMPLGQQHLEHVHNLLHANGSPMKCSKKPLCQWHMKMSSRSSVTGENHFCSVVIKGWVNAYYSRKQDWVFEPVLAMKRFQCKNCVVLHASASVEAGPLFTSMNYLLLQLSTAIKNCFGQPDEGG